MQQLTEERCTDPIATTISTTAAQPCQCSTSPKPMAPANTPKIEIVSHTTVDGAFHCGISNVTLRPVITSVVSTVIQNEIAKAAARMVVLRRPSFMMGQFKPQASVSKTRRMSCRWVSCMGRAR